MTTITRTFLSVGHETLISIIFLSTYITCFLISAVGLTEERSGAQNSGRQRMRTCDESCGRKVKSSAICGWGAERTRKDRKDRRRN